MMDAVQSVLNKYATFSGRATRSEYWYWVLAMCIVSIVLNIIGGQVAILMILSPIFSLATLVPTIAVAIRRMHDVGKSGWFILIPLYNLYLAIQPSEGPNAYGSTPSSMGATA